MTGLACLECDLLLCTATYNILCARQTAQALIRLINY